MQRATLSAIQAISQTASNPSPSLAGANLWQPALWPWNLMQGAGAANTSSAPERVTAVAVGGKAWSERNGTGGLKCTDLKLVPAFAFPDANLATAAKAQPPNTENIEPRAQRKMPWPTRLVDHLECDPRALCGCAFLSILTVNEVLGFK
ncbi:MAG: hypothetical protein IPI44_24020 [Sulfuritalea sp.]|nr:hypothetical protein [Sulfuritalea sp.]